MEYVFSMWGMIIIGAICLCIALCVTEVAKQWRKARVAEIEASLKAEMIKQGRSAEEMEQILKTSGRATTSVAAED